MWQLQQWQINLHECYSISDTHILALSCGVKKKIFLTGSFSMQCKAQKACIYLPVDI
jgi:hypothetical protein